MKPRSRWMALALAFASIPAGGLGAQEVDDPARLLAAGEDAYDEGDFEMARERLEEYLVATDDVTGPSRLPRARAIYTLGLMESDAAVAARRYETVVEEYPASSVADQAIFRLGVLALMEGRSEEARERFRELDRTYPYSRLQPELPLWVGRTYLSEERYTDASDVLLDGYTKVKSRDLPVELPRAQREALEAEYAWWLAATFRQEGDLRTATQYYSLLMLDYPGSPQAEDARHAMAEIEESDLAERPTGKEIEPRADGVGPAERERGDEADARADALARAEPERREEPPLVRTAPPSRLEDPGDRIEPETAPAREPERDFVDEPADDFAEEPEGADPERPAVERQADVGPAALVRGVEEGPVYLQVGAFTSATRAADLSNRLRADGFDPGIEIAIVDGQGYYRVRLGPYRMPEQESVVEANRRRLAQRGYPADRVAADRDSATRVDR